MGKDTLLTTSQVIHKRRMAVETRKDYISLLFRIIILAAAGWILFTQVFLVTQASGNGMYPAVRDGDLLVGYRLQAEYTKDDVVIYEVDGEQRAGRILGRGTDIITIDENGTLMVNGTVQGGEIFFPTYAKEGLKYPYTVPEDTVFILGDYRTQSEDSRDFGCIPVEDVKAKIITILRRREL